MNESKPLVIGLAGGTGSGKTTVAHGMLAQASGKEILMIPQDAYYCAQHGVSPEERALTNYDEPAAFDTELLIRQVDELIAGQSVEQPVYDFANHNRAEETLKLEPALVIIIEGILVLHDPLLRERMDLKVFVDAPPDERFIRRLERDVQERGRSAQSVIKQYRSTVKPMHDLYVEPTKQHADLIFPVGGQNKIALEVLSTFVKSVLEKRHNRA